MNLDIQTLSYGVALSRIGIGAVAIAAPGLAMNLWLAADPRSEKVKAMGLALGARDMVIGIGTLQALRGEGNPALWLKFGALADGADGIGTLRAFKDDPRNPRMLISLVAIGFAAVGLILGRRQEELGSGG